MQECECNGWLYQTGIKTSNKRYSKGDIPNDVFILIHTFTAHLCYSTFMLFSVKIKEHCLSKTSASVSIIKLVKAHSGQGIYETERLELK